MNFKKYSDINLFWNDNQKLLEEISIYNSKKYCENTIVLEYFKKDMEEIINEIIN